MTGTNAAAEATVTEVALPGKVEPSGLRLVQRALPPPAAGQALVRVESTAVSFAESAMRRGRYYGQPPFPVRVTTPPVARVAVCGRCLRRERSGAKIAGDRRQLAVSRVVARAIPLPSVRASRAARTWGRQREQSRHSRGQWRPQKRAAPR
jgi:hypothetical protein